MAVRKRITGSLKVVSFFCDDAIDRTKTPRLDYLQTRDEGLVVPNKGEQLTWFTLKPLSGDLPEHCRSYPSPMAERVAMQFGVTTCSDLDLIPSDSWEGEGDRRHLKDSVIDELQDNLRTELGTVALQMGDLSSGEERRFVPPAGLQVTRRQRSATTAESVTDSGPESQES